MRGLALYWAIREFARERSDRIVVRPRPAGTVFERDRRRFARRHPVLWYRARRNIRAIMARDAADAKWAHAWRDAP